MFLRSKPRRAVDLVAILVVVVGTLLVGCGIESGVGDSVGRGTADAAPTAARSDSGPDAPPPRASPVVARERRCADFPTPTCTGVPVGTTLTELNGDLVVRTAGQVIDGAHVTGALLIGAPGVTVRNSQIDGGVDNYFNGEPRYAFTITDSTIGLKSGCDSTGYALGEGSFVAERVHIRGFGDGIRASAPDITVKDSYIKLCSTQEESHSDGIQDYPRTSNLVFDHNTVDQCGPVPTDGECRFGGGFTAPVFVNSDTDGGTRGARITNNLLMGGVYVIYVHPQPGAPWIVTGNRIVNGTWSYAPAESGGLCNQIDAWTDNAVVEIDEDYRVTAVQQAVPCPR